MNSETEDAMINEQGRLIRLISKTPEEHSFYYDNLGIITDIEIRMRMAPFRDLMEIGLAAILDSDFYTQMPYIFQKELIISYSLKESSDDIRIAGFHMEDIPFILEKSGIEKIEDLKGLTYLVSKNITNQYPDLL